MTALKLDYWASLNREWPRTQSPPPPPPSSVGDDRMTEQRGESGVNPPIMIALVLVPIASIGLFFIFLARYNTHVLSAIAICLRCRMPSLHLPDSLVQNASLCGAKPEFVGLSSAPQVQWPAQAAKQHANASRPWPSEHVVRDRYSGQHSAVGSSGCSADGCISQAPQCIGSKTGGQASRVSLLMLHLSAHTHHQQS